MHSSKLRPYHDNNEGKDCRVLVSNARGRFELLGETAEGEVGNTSGSR